MPHSSPGLQGGLKPEVELPENLVRGKIGPGTEWGFLTLCLPLALLARVMAWLFTKGTPQV